MPEKIKSTKELKREIKESIKQLEAEEKRTGKDQSVAIGILLWCEEKINSFEARMRNRFRRNESVVLSNEEARNVFQEAFNKYWQPFKLTEECLQLSTEKLDRIIYAWDVGKFCNGNTTRGIEEHELPYPLLNAEACDWCTFAAGIMLLRYSKLVEELHGFIEGEGGDAETAGSGREPKLLSSKTFSVPDTPRENEEIERYLILLLGVVDKPIPSREHLQKELFIATQVNPTMAQFIYFEAYYNGPFSPDVEDVVENPLYYTGAYFVGKEIELSDKGKEIFKQLNDKYAKNTRFRKFVASLRMIREFYDKLTKDELLLLIHIAYPKYIQYSSVYDKLMRRKEKIVKKLYDKGAITKKRYLEILEAAGPKIAAAAIHDKIKKKKEKG